MTFEEIKNFLAGYHKGQFVRIGWQSTIESAKARKSGHEVKKVSSATVRIGIRYENLKAVKLMREQNGEPQKVVIWFRHNEDIPEVLEHLNDADKMYLQVFTVRGGGNPKVQYFIDGEEATKTDVLNSGLCNPSAFTDTSDKLVFNLPIENIRFIGTQA